jgi:hypothetical protein
VKPEALIHETRVALITLVLSALSLTAAAEPQSGSSSALQACANIADTAARLACYDQLAGRSAPNAPAPATPSAAPAVPPAAPSMSQQTPAAAPAPAPVPAPVPAPASAAPVTARAPSPSAAPAPAGSASPSPPPSKETFGLYSAEHPKPPPNASALEAPVVSLGKSVSGRQIVLLDGGALWELDEPDPLLAVGDVVTITRATLGSYLMKTPTRRFHRVRRLQ